MDTVYEIKVSECPIVVKDSIDESWKTVPVNILYIYKQKAKTKKA